MFNFEFSVADGVKKSMIQAGDGGILGFVGFDSAEKIFQVISVPFDLDKHTLRRVIHPPIQSKVCGKAVDKWAKSNALHHTTNRYF